MSTAYLQSLHNLEQLETSMSYRKTFLLEIASLSIPEVADQISTNPPEPTAALLIELLNYYRFSQSIRDTLPETA